MSEQDIEKRFLEDVKSHQMHVVLDDGLNRHLQFKKEGTMCYYFNITTWAGHLAISGDMGTWVFSRLTDMFSFFRSEKGESTGGELFINTGYWAEKLQAYDRQGEWLTFSSSRLEKEMRRQFSQWQSDNDVPVHIAESAWNQIEEDILHADSDAEAHQYVNDYIFSRAEETDGGSVLYELEFPDAWELCFKEPRFHYVWCCYAIAHAIRCYDEYKAKSEVAA